MPPGDVGSRRGPPRKRDDPKESVRFDVSIMLREAHGRCVQPRTPLPSRFNIRQGRGPYEDDILERDYQFDPSALRTVQ